jgi:hypothetical protein
MAKAEQAHRLRAKALELTTLTLTLTVRNLDDLEHLFGGDLGLRRGPDGLLLPLERVDAAVKRIIDHPAHTGPAVAPRRVDGSNQRSTKRRPHSG